MPPEHAFLLCIHYTHTKNYDSDIAGHHVDSSHGYGGEKEVEVAVVPPGNTVPYLQ